jgi:hypothetical protein
MVIEESGWDHPTIPSAGEYSQPWIEKEGDERDSNCYREVLWVLRVVVLWAECCFLVTFHT